MSTFYIPNNAGQIRQINQGDVYGELWSTFNIDLTSSPGKIKASKRLTSGVSVAKMDNDDVHAFQLYKGYLHAFAVGRRLFIEAGRNPRISGNWTSTTTALDIGDETDAIVFDGKLLVSTGTNIASTTDANGNTFDDDWWTAVVSGTALTGSRPHIMDVSRIGRETLFVTDGNLVRYYNTAAGHSTVTLATQLTACCLATDYAATWVGTYSSDGNAYVYEIYVGETGDGGTPIARNAYVIDGTAVLSMDVIEGVVYIVTDRGHVQVFNGRSFVTVASFPFASIGVTLAGMTIGNINTSNIERAIHPKGMRRYNRSLFININTTNQIIEDLAANPTDDDDIFENVIVNERSPSGVWEFNADTQVLNHRYSLTYDTSSKGYHKQLTSSPVLVVDNEYTRLLTAGRVETDETQIFVEDYENEPLSYFITPEIISDTIEEAWEKVVLKANRLVGSETIEVKYRKVKSSSYPEYAAISWLTPNTLTYVGTLAAQVGDEVEVISGNGAGKVAHIVSISGSSTLTVELDDSIGTANELATVRFDNWKKIDTSMIATTGEYKSFGVNETGPWIQFKVVMKGRVELRQFISKGNAKTLLG
jgi:hypothetical protein